MKPALLLVDLQADYLAGVAGAGRLVARVSALLEGFRARGLPVVHAWTTCGPGGEGAMPHWRAAGIVRCVAGTPGHAPPAALRPFPGEPAVHKRFYSAFEGDLAEVLREEGCDTLVLAGVHLHACVRATALDAYARGLGVWIAEDAVASDDPLHAAATRRWLERRAARFLPGAAILHVLDHGVPPRLVHRSPRDPERVLREIPLAGPAEVAAAADAARGAWETWRATDPDARRGLLLRVAARVREEAEALALLLAEEVGKPLVQARDEVRRAVASVEDAAGRTQPVPGRREVGVVAAVTPWNNPLAIPLGKIAPALAFGNTVVWKPAPAGTGVAAVVQRLLGAAGCPPGAVALVPGDAATARDVAEDSRVDAVALTGAPEAGWALQEICARRAVPFQAELGGNNAAVVWDDAALEPAAASIAEAAFAFAGQRCTAIRRVVVPRPLRPRFLDLLAAATARLPWGDPCAEETCVGPLLTVAKRDEVAALVAGAPHARTPHPPGPAPRTYLAPVLVHGCAPSSELVQEETFGPVLVLQEAEDFDEALALVNGVRQGLLAALFSPSPELRRRFLREAAVGIVALDTALPRIDVGRPFGGWKASGAGPAEHGPADVEFHTRTQTVYE